MTILALQSTIKVHLLHLWWWLKLQMCCTGNEAVCNPSSWQTKRCEPLYLLFSRRLVVVLTKNVFATGCHLKLRAAEEKATRERTPPKKSSFFYCIIVFIYWPSIEIIIQPSRFMLAKHRTGLILRTRCSWVYVILQWKERHKYNSVVLRWHQKSASGYLKLLVMFPIKNPCKFKCLCLNMCCFLELKVCNLKLSY